MPNHVTTKIFGPPAMLEAITRKHNEKDVREREEHTTHMRSIIPGYTGQPLDMDRVFVDFGMVIPEPENIETGPCTGEHPDGVVCWYSWNITNWGTKWNAYSVKIEQLSPESVMIQFDTAWAHPVPVIDKLSRQVPQAPLIVLYADEDLGANLGNYTIQDGMVLQEETFTSDAARLEFAAQVVHGVSYVELQAQYGEEG